jgi:hypothetical protein
MRGVVPNYGHMLPCRPGSSRRASQPKPIGYPPAANGCMRLSTTGFRIIGRKTTGARVRLYSCPGNDLTRRFPLIVDASPPR